MCFGRMLIDLAVASPAARGSLTDCEMRASRLQAMVGKVVATRLMHRAARRSLWATPVPS